MIYFIKSQLPAIIFTVMFFLCCSNEGKDCSKEGCGDALSCDPFSNTCRETCAKDNDCKKGLLCDTKLNSCHDPIRRKKLKAIAQKKKALEELEILKKRWIKLGIDMILIPGGSFKMGANDDKSAKPVHSITLHDFYMSKTEVTVKQYRACVRAGACSTEGFKSKEWTNYYKYDRGDYPINGVSWYQARAFAKWIGGDLPSESQWEYAARSGGKDWKYPWGNEKASCKYAIIEDDTRPHFERGGCGKGIGRTWPVCSRSKGNSTHGVCDLIGNVYEWVSDKWHEDYNGAPDNGYPWDDGVSSFHVIRGCSSSCSIEYNSFHPYMSVPRSRGRYRRAPNEGGRYSIGFRVVKRLPNP
jgi:formylglycine-generating enzyme required for sulfatase activity